MRPAGGAGRHRGHAARWSANNRSVPAFIAAFPDSSYAPAVPAGTADPVTRARRLAAATAELRVSRS